MPKFFFFSEKNFEDGLKHFFVEQKGYMQKKLIQGSWAN